MARTGSALVIAAVLFASRAHAEVEFTMQADVEKVGTEDTFRLEIVVGNAPDGAALRAPDSPNFEILGRSESSQMSYSMGPGGAGVMNQVRKFTLTMRANETGMQVIPPAKLTFGGKTMTTNPVTIQVVKGRLQPERPRRAQPPNPFGFPPGFRLPPGFGPDLDDEPQAPPSQPFDGDEPVVPRGDSDLFMRMSADKTDVYVGEQVMITIHLYSRVDLSSVDGVTMPKLDGFLSQDFKSPSQLNSTQRVIGGVPYREFLLRQKAVFPLKPGTATIDAPEADITTGSILYTGRRVHRKGNELKLNVKTLPPGPANAIVGRWRLSREVSQTEVALGEPVQVKLTLEGRGNLQSVTLPPLNPPAAFRAFDPEVADKPNNSRSHVGGTRVVEYTLVPQQTGSFVLPEIVVPYFDPETRKYDEMRVDDITITVRPGTGGANVIGTPGPTNNTLDGPKNQLVGGGLKSLRHTAKFSAPPRPLSALPWFLPVALAPVVLSMLAAAFAFARNSLGQRSPESLKKREARAARKRLAAAEKLLSGGSTTAFYEEVERALSGFMTAKLGTPTTGLTRAQLTSKLVDARVAEADRARILAVLDLCDLGRYAPGMGEASARRKAIDDAAAAMEGWS